MPGTSKLSSVGAHSGRRPGLMLLNRWVSRSAMVVAAILTVAMFGASTAAAYWKASGTASTTAATATLQPPTSVSVPSASSTSVPVSWTASAGTLAPAGYYVTRTTGASTVPACGSGPAALIAGTSCTDSAVPLGSYTYAVTAIYRSWSARSAASGSVAVAVPVANRLAFTVSPGNVTAGAAISPAVAVSLQTVAGLPVLTANTPVTLGIGANPGAGTLSGTVTASTNSMGVATFPGLSINKAGVGYSLSASSPGLASATGSAFNVTAAATSSLVIKTAAVSGAASASANLGPITVERRDAYGNLVTAGAVSLPLSSNSAGSSIFSGTAGGAAVTALTIPAGASSASFYYGDTKAASPAITVGSGTATASQNATITASAVARVAFTSIPRTAAASATANSAAISIQRQDAFGNPVAAPAGGTSVSLASNSAGTRIFSATLGGASVTSVTIPAGSSSTSFFYGDTKAGSSTITVSGTGLTPDSQTATVLAAAPSRLLFGQQPTITAKGAPISPAVTVLIVDQFGNRTASTASVSIAKTDVQGNLSGTLAKAAISGEATFSDLSIHRPDTGYQLEATSGGLVLATSGRFTIF
ncbi:hypothetical protein V3C33_14180 [Micrococcaceae bacterium Sec5.7]